MDFMKWLNSLDEALYEVMSWLLFFPLTLWRAIVQPVQTMQSVEIEAALPEDERYARLLSPPLFLALGLLLAHGLSMTLGQSDEIVANQHGLAGLVDDATTALLLRVIVFASFPLFLAAHLVRRSGAPHDRTALRQPFYQQCYPGAVLALGISMSTSLLSTSAASTRTVGTALLAATLVHFFIVETHWFAIRSKGRHAGAAASVSIAVLEGALFVLIIGWVFTR